MSSTTEVLAASKAFYAALNRMAQGDATAMASVWATQGCTTAQHPIGGRDTGYETIISSFARVAGIAGGGEIRLVDQTIEAGTDMAVETGVEVGTLVIAGHEATLDHRVTNVYCLQDGAWKLMHHHTDTSPGMLDILERLAADAPATQTAAS
ncbi:YybH family protein [Maliponia aquimaris]|uniref:SnoaL-like domain-containing protein n=1 Tax=Maliponia aquimaris TaxID=1673631 RepID=A0A238KYR1_9RHOB|nr:nuclear transport factor 2 family protein [Maliponia aquimaris]SMX47919.1 hypothetical protein MAA8898_03799 [Maliponia aquimaris]